ncbi:MAG: hypothetical protein KH304_00690 [Clostridium sp.]|nr:hypothetical protein [Clostridium sp.]
MTGMPGRCRGYVCRCSFPASVVKLVYHGGRGECIHWLVYRLWAADGLAGCEKYAKKFVE